jgi:hypothetical protein
MTTSLSSVRSFPWRDEIRYVFRLHDAPWRWLVGIDAGFALGLPLALFTLAGHQSAGLVASMGGFTALYYAALPRVDRLRVLPLVAAGFAGASLLGVLSATGAWWTIACLVFVALLACFISFGIRMGPPGPMMFVLVSGVCNYMAAPEALERASRERFDIPALVAIGAISAYLVSMIPLFIPSLRRREGDAPAFRSLIRFSRPDRINTFIASRVVVAVLIASLLSVPFSVGHAYWVVMIAGVSLQVSHSLRHTTVRVIHRVLGTLLGIAVFGLVALADPSGMWLVLLLASLQCIIEIVVARHYGLALIFITPLALTISTVGNPSDTPAIINDRIIDTLFGAAIAMVVLWTSARWLNRHGLKGA